MTLTRVVGKGRTSEMPASELEAMRGAYVKCAVDVGTGDARFAYHLASERPDWLVLGLDVQDLSEKARAFAKTHGVAYPSLRETGDSAYRDYQLTGLPETFVIDPQGRIALKVVGEVTDPAQLTTAIDQLRGGWRSCSPWWPWRRCPRPRPR